MEYKEENLDDISLDNFKHQFDVWCRTYNISREKIELFHDFLISLHELIDTTYFGPKFIQDKDEKIHFTWCWDKTINNFEKERIFFKERGDHYEYFWVFFLEAFYICQVKGNETKINNYLNNLFNINNIKTRSELDVLLEVYKILEQNLKK
jgi:hypothetical protein